MVSTIPNYNVRPNAPPASPYHNQWVYGNETGCDVVFLAGQDSGEIWRLPAHTSVLKEKNALFEIMFSGRFSQQQAVDVPDVEGRAFDNLLRFLYEEPVSVQSVETALGTLYAGHKYQCYGLVRLCIAYLLDNFKETNILLILKFIRVFCGNDCQKLENARPEGVKLGSQPKTTNICGSDPGHRVQNCPVRPMELFSYNPDVSLTSATSGISASHVSNHVYTTNTCIEDECSNLLQHCLTFIDNHATAVLGSDEMDDLDLPTLRVILARDTLNVEGDEGIVFSAISQWADKECKRKQLPLTGASKRELLGDSLYLPRYLTMSLKSFQDGPARSDLLTPKEIMLLDELIKSGSVGSPKHKANTESASGSKNSTLTTASVIKLIQHAPASLLPHLQSIAIVRRAGDEISHVVSSSAPPSPSKKCGLSFFKLMRLKICCLLTRSRSGSKESTPCVSLNSSPMHNQNGPNQGYTNPGYAGRMGAGPEYYTVVNGPDVPPSERRILERIVVCLACFLD